MEVIVKDFLNYAYVKIAGCGYNNGLSNSEIDTLIAKYAVKYNVHILPCHQKKSDKLKNAIDCFSDI